MASAYRQELTVVPPVRIAVRRTGLETTVDWSGARVDRDLARSATTFGYVGDLNRSGPLATGRFLIPGTRTEYGGGDLTRMTSPGLEAFKNVLEATRARDAEIRAEIGRARVQVALSWTARALAWVTLVPAVSKPFRKKLSTALATRRGEVSTLRENLAASRVSVSFNMETPVADPHRRMLASFDEMAASSRSWAVRSTQAIDRVRARSAAGIVVDRNLVALRRAMADLVDTDDPPLALPIQRGRATAYFYPGFLLVARQGAVDFALVDARELTIAAASTHFTEAEGVPSDSTMVRKVWAKSNKNGTRDRRFKDNRELPVMLYGELAVTGPGGLNESLMLSRDGPCHAFAAAFRDLQRVLRSGMTDRLTAAPRLRFDRG